MKKYPLVSIVLITYNRRFLLPYAIQSVISQTYSNYEIIVVNDCGEDVWDIIESFKSDKIKYLSHIKNSGLPFARNTALKASHGDIICYLDDDDLFLDNHLEILVEEFQKKDTDLVLTDSYFVEEELRDGKRRELERLVPYKGINFSIERLLVANFIPVNSWVHRSFLIEKTGYFDELLSSHEDWDMLIRIALKANNITYTEKKTVEVRHRKNIADNMLHREQRNFYNVYNYIYKKHPVSKLKILKERQGVLYMLAKDENKLWVFFKEVFSHPLKIIIFIYYGISKIKDKIVSN